MHSLDDALVSCFFFNDTATTEIYTLSLHDALPISARRLSGATGPLVRDQRRLRGWVDGSGRSISTPIFQTLWMARSEEHTSELQSRQYLVCRLLLEKKKQFARPLPPRPLLTSIPVH